MNPGPYDKLSSWQKLALIHANVEAFVFHLLTLLGNVVPWLWRGREETRMARTIGEGVL